MVSNPLLEDVYLYILVRTDLSSMNAGKACAQATHAANQCVYDIHKSQDAWLNVQLLAWQEDRGFGTCIVLGATIDEIYKTTGMLMAAGHHNAIVHDPSYPLRDGDFTHLIPLDTCAYAFGRKSILEPFLCHLSLMP